MAGIDRESVRDLLLKFLRANGVIDRPKLRERKLVEARATRSTMPK